MAQTLTGGCPCGAVRYTVSADFIFSGTGHGSVFAEMPPPQG